MRKKFTFDEFLILDHGLTPSEQQDDEVRKNYVDLYQEYLDDPNEGYDPEPVFEDDWIGR